MVGDNRLSFEAYEHMAGYYYNDVDKKPFNAYYERPATTSLLSEVKGKRVLDAGCAAGWYTKWLVDRGAIVTAIDFSPRMVALAQKRVGDKAKVFVADLNEPLSFLLDGGFAIILASLTLHYIKDWQQIMNEFNRLLKTGGHLVFSIHHPFMDFVHFKKDDYFATELLEDEWQVKEEKVKVHFYRRPLCEVTAPLFRNGFTIEEILEPMPSEELKEIHSGAYERLTKSPQFLFVRARKE